MRRGLELGALGVAADEPARRRMMPSLASEDSDRQVARAGAVEHGRDLGDEVGGEAAAAGVLEDVTSAFSASWTQ